MIGGKDLMSLPFMVVMHSRGSTLDQLYLEVSVNNTQGSFRSGNINIGLSVSAALIVLKLLYKEDSS